MSDTSTYADYDDQVDDEEESIDQLRRAAKDGRKAAAEREQAKAEADAIRRELAMVKAGIDTESRLGQMFMASYDGELDPAAIKAEWAELGVPTTTADGANRDVSSEEDIPSEERRQTSERETLATGSTDAPDEEAGPDPLHAGMDAFSDRMQKGGTRAGASGEVFRRLIDAGARGDERVLWQGWTDEELAEAREATR